MRETWDDSEKAGLNRWGKENDEIMYEHCFTVISLQCD